ncbi:MAG: hypothetical protein VKN33_07210 [Candidatus Sericytochromatia bacterium]|nr:hypothetical protein [Candidatus Sericytochromatia bacterium]
MLVFNQWGGGLRAGVAAVLLFLAMPGTALAQLQTLKADVKSDFTGVPLAVYAPVGGPVWATLREKLRATGRVGIIDLAPTPGESSAAYVTRVRAKAAAGGELYVLIPEYRVGAVEIEASRTDRTEKTTKKTSTRKGKTKGARSSAKKSTGFDARTYTNVTCRLEMTLTLVDAKTGAVLFRRDRQRTLLRSFDYRHDEGTSRAARRLMERQMLEAVERVRHRAPQDVFASGGAFNQGVDGLIDSAVQTLSDAEPLRLQVIVSGWSSKENRVRFNLGRNLSVRQDAGFRVMNGLEQVGYVKVRELADRESSAEPLYLKRPIRASDRVVEDRKNGFHLGYRIPFAGFARGDGVSANFVGASLFGEWSMAGGGAHLSEWYLGTGFTGGPSPRGFGSLFDVGVAKKFCFGPWAVRAGSKLVAAHLGEISAGTAIFGGALATGLEYHLNEHLLVAVDVDGVGFLPTLTDGVNYFGVGGSVFRTGLTSLF